ncbi:MAG: hypothetical protein AAFO86_05665 [Pseudomonadota bacterium]
MKDGYNPAEAMERSAQYLGALQRWYGNLGLTAAAYNGCERRADGFVQGRGLARETMAYVRIITGLRATDWRDALPSAHSFALDGDVSFMTACLCMAQRRKVSPLRPPSHRRSARGVQLGYGATQTEAEARVTRLTRRCASQVGREQLEYVTVRSRVRRRTAYVMGRIGQADLAGADALCRALARAGCLCRVYRNPD